MDHSKRGAVLVTTLLFAGAIALGCGGTGGEPAAPTPTGDDASPEKAAKRGKGKAGKGELKVGASAARRRGGDPERLPSGGVLERERRKDQYVVKLARGVEVTGLQGGLETNRPKLNQAFANLGVDQARQVHRKGAKNQKAADAFGVGRTLRIRSGKPMDQVVATLEDIADVEWVEPVSEMVVHGKVPNDPYWTYQWHMQNLRVNDAWPISQGEGVVVAVVDTGVSVNEDGFHRILPGWDFVDDDATPDDLNGHGTHVAGTIGQQANNGIGVVGVAPRVTILPVRVLDANGSGDNTNVSEGILWAVDQGAHIINLSLGSHTPSEAVADAVAYAYEHGVTVIAATGNDGYTDFVGFPAAYRTPIAVGSVDLQSTVAFYSNQGQEIDLVGPGGDTSGDRNGDGQVDGVLQETRMGDGWGYYQLQGTSMATPHVAGVAALVYAMGVKDPDDLRHVLQTTSSDLGAKGWDATYGHGMVNPVEALAAAQDAPRRHRRRQGGDFEITDTEVRKAGRSRAVITWTTSAPASTSIRTDGAQERSDATETRFHKVIVFGRPGSSETYTIASAAGPKQKDKETVQVTF